MKNLSSMYHKVSYNTALSRIILLLPALALLSCGGEGEHPLKEEHFYLEDSNREWLTADSLGSVFVMRDQNGVSTSFRMQSRSEEMGKSWTTVMGINTVTTYTEECFQDYQSTYGLHLSISMRANTPPHGDDISISLGETGFSYDFDFEQVHHLDTPFGYKYLLTTDKGYEAYEDGEIRSRVELLDQLETESGAYSDVMHFTFDDFKEEWNDFTVSEIWMARHVGLVKYTLAGGITAVRIQQ